MFIIEQMFIEDKKLAKVLTALAGLVFKMEPPRPVVNVAVKNGKLTQASNGSTLKEQVIEELQELGKGTTITMRQLNEIIHKKGGGGNSKSYYVRAILQAKAVKRKSRGEYVVQ